MTGRALRTLAVDGLRAARALPVETARGALLIAQNPVAAVGTGVGVLRSGVVPTFRPDLILRQLDSVRREGVSLAGAVAAAAALQPRGLAIVDDAGTRTWAQLDGDGRRLAAAFADLGICVGDRVGLLCRNHGEFVTCLLALARLGVDAVLLNVGSAPDQLARIVAAQRMRLIVADTEFVLPTLPAGVRVVTAWDDRGPERAGVRELIRQTRDDRDVARPMHGGRLIVLTSGTTGTPKGAARPEPSVVAALLAVAGLLGRVPLRAQTPTAIPAPLFHAWGLGALQLALTARCPIVLARQFDAARLMGLIATHRVQQLFLVPVMLSRLLALPEHLLSGLDHSALRLIVSSGSALSPATVRASEARFGPVLHNLYGSTEASWVSVAGPAQLHREPGSAGRPPLGTRLTVLDSEGLPCPIGVSGRIFVGNSMLFDGYTDHSTIDTNPNGLMPTGDLGHLDPRGWLHVDGREDDLVICGGENVFCGEVADVLSDIAGITEAAVLGVPDPEFGQRLAAFVVTAPGSALTAEDVRAIVRERLARHAVPRDVTFLEALPRNAAGKVLARVLRQDRA
ncbi:MAG TPA: AMP-binding protein [Sporichthyaceae bacterium]|nr:AMP-binding protein [Sporichthyaceae bacterium]